MFVVILAETILAWIGLFDFIWSYWPYVKPYLGLFETLFGLISPYLKPYLGLFQLISNLIWADFNLFPLFQSLFGQIKNIPLRKKGPIVGHIR